MKRKRKRKKCIGAYSLRAKRRLRLFFLAQVLLLAAYLLLCGVFYAQNGTERLWHGKSAPLIGYSDIKNWIDGKWDLFLDEFCDTIKPKQ